MRIIIDIDCGVGRSDTKHKERLILEELKKKLEPDENSGYSLIEDEVELDDLNIDPEFTLLIAAWNGNR